ncbi:response regulator [Muricauda sp. SCSIO 64092]|uniref:LytR/AlgR family response regulator transcription factor n=1 Tax=Allomuricauda sp. SCSIO 64092 TaxID=2908842 RepID=UPI001FF2AF27|nr:response regulator [Muricauda sp. SCSIO 64092]UOY07435.1 response regulator [Muricauda sp. SCSIO 64092]
MNYKTVIIDDSSVHRLAISFLVQNHPKLQLIGAYSDPYEGIKAIYEHNVDIVFMDILLDNLNAFELLDQIQIPAAIVLNSSWEKFSSRARQYGIQYFLTKPMQKSAFETAVKGVLQSLESDKVKKHATS